MDRPFAFPFFPGRECEADARDFDISLLRNEAVELTIKDAALSLGLCLVAIAIGEAFAALLA